MARNRELESADFMAKEMNGVIDMMHLPSSGGVEPVNDREFDMRTAEGKVEYEKFMREPIVVIIHPTQNENDPLVADPRLNGVQLPLPRNVKLRIPRAFVEVLAQSQERRFSQVRDPNPDATIGMVTHRHGGASFPFAILHDPSPAKGQAWLERVTRVAA